MHTVIDDHSRVAYAEIHDDETAATAIGVLRRAVSWFEARGVTVERVLSDNGSAYKSHAWRDACNELGSESAHRAALPAGLHEYNHHRPHTAIGAKPSISRSANVPGQYSLPNVPAR